MNAMLKRYRLFIILLVVNVGLVIVRPALGWEAAEITGKNLLEMLSVLPPIFILLGLLDVWVERDLMIKLMGEKSGFIGILIAFFLGSAAAGPLYAAFPIAGVLLRKGSKLSNVLIFIGAWSTTKIPMLLFETSAMGWKFMLIRFLINIPGIALIAYVTERVLGVEEKKAVYVRAGEMDN
jgi:uncharacterized membrane protein YraQ (UPF0718 family)